MVRAAATAVFFALALGFHAPANAEAIPAEKLNGNWIGKMAGPAGDFKVELTLKDGGYRCKITGRLLPGDEEQTVEDAGTYRHESNGRYIFTSNVFPSVLKTYHLTLEGDDTLVSLEQGIGRRVEYKRANAARPARNER
jgi:hypothetical protein